MISLVQVIKKYYRLIFGGIFLIYIVFSLTATYLVYDVLINNALTVTSFVNTLFKKTANDIEEKVNISKDIFTDIEQKYKKNILKQPFDIEKYIRTRYFEKYDVAIISEKGIIIETTNLKEKNLDLSQYPDCKKSFEEARKTLKLLIDYPVINSDFKSFYIYLLKYIPEKKVYLQIGYKIMIFSEMSASFIDIDLRTNDHFDFSVYYVYLDKDFMNVKLYGNYEKLSQETVRDLLNKPNNFFLFKSFNDIKLFRVISQNKGFAIIYLLHIKPLSKTVIISWITFNIILILLLFILYEKFIFIVRKKIENPLREIKNYVNESKPYQYVGDIAELKDLAETYEHHLEKTKTRDFLKEVLKAQEQERERIARDIHDIVIQNLNYILIRLNQNNQKELAELLKSQIQELRNMVIDGDLVILKNWE